MSESYDLVLRGGVVVTPEGVSTADVAVLGGKIAQVSPALSGAGREEIDARGKYVMAGVIDSHVHFNEPGRTEWEGIATGSLSLARGGGTAFFDMPLNSLPPSVDAVSFALKREAASRSSVTDFGLWGGLIPGNADRLEELRDAGAVGFKAFMCASGVDEFPAADAPTLRTGMRRAAELGMMVAVHAEDDAMAAKLAQEARRNGSDPRTWLSSRPVALELEAIRVATEIAGETRCRLHIVHVSNPEGVELARKARARGVDVTVETCPHYLLLNEEDGVRQGAVAKCCPPLRPEAIRLALWAEVEAGRIDTIGSDHSPAPASMKQSADFFAIWGGISGCQHAFELLVSEAVKRHGPARALPLLTQLLSARVADRFGVAGSKGRIASGLDADLVVWSLGVDHVLSNETLSYRHRQGPYGGRRSTAEVERTLVRGRTVWCKGWVAPGAPMGQFVQPA